MNGVPSGGPAGVLPRWIDANTIRIPVAVRTDDEDDVTGDGAGTVRAGDPAFQEWAEWLEATGHPQPRE